MAIWMWLSICVCVCLINKTTANLAGERCIALVRDSERYINLIHTTRLKEKGSMGFNVDFLVSTVLLVELET